MDSEKTRKIAYLSVAILGTGMLLYLFMKYVFMLILPFLIAWAVAFGMRRPAAVLGKITKLPERVLRLILTLTVTMGTITLLVLGLWRLSSEIIRFFSGAAGGDTIENVLSNLTSDKGVFGELFSQLGGVIKDAVGSLISSILSSVGRLVSVWVSGLPKVLLFIIITVVSSLYFAWDLETVNSAVRRLLPRRAYDFCRGFKAGAAAVGLRYLRSYLLLMLIAFSVMLAGFLILDIPYAFLLALLFSFVDLLPILGVGVALIPWSIYELVFGSSGLGIGLIVIYLIHTVVRQFAEPRILGKNLGVHPILTLIFLYVGYSLFGFAGLILGPLITVLFNITFAKKDAAKVGEHPVGEGDST